MRLTTAEKGEVIRLVEGSDLSVRQTLRELAWQFTDREGHFLSDSSVYRILKAYDLIASPAFIVLSAGKTFQQPTHRPNELWQTNFTYLHVVGGGWYYVSTVLTTTRGTSSRGCCARPCRPPTVASILTFVR